MPKTIKSVLVLVAVALFAAWTAPERPQLVDFASQVRIRRSEAAAQLIAKAVLPVSNSTRATSTTATPATELAAAAAPPTTLAPTTTQAPPPPPPPPSTTSPWPPITAPATPPTAAVLPSGKGMWIYLPEYAEGSDPHAIVARAHAVGLTHLYVRTGSSVDGFYAAQFLDALLPVAHAGGIRVIGWDFPYLNDVDADVARALQAITYTTPTGDHLDGFSPDIETWFEGVNLSAETAGAYGAALRAAVGPGFLLIGTVPRASAARQADYPYEAIAPWADAIAPMVYWIDQAPETETAVSMNFLAQFGRPIMPVGQAYDSSLEGGPPGTPTGADVTTFMNIAADWGAPAVSFWSWQHASDEIWNAIEAWHRQP